MINDHMKGFLLLVSILYTGVFALLMFGLVVLHGFPFGATALYLAAILVAAGLASAVAYWLTHKRART